jgi:hypothetical protein
MELGVILVSRIAGMGFAVPLVVDGDSPAEGDETADQEKVVPARSGVKVVGAVEVPEQMT